jgi:hypothetical protein
MRRELEAKLRAQIEELTAQAATWREMALNANATVKTMADLNAKLIERMEKAESHEVPENLVNASYDIRGVDDLIRWHNDIIVVVQIEPGKKYFVYNYETERDEMLLPQICPNDSDA